MRTNLIKSIIIIFFFLGITITNSYAKCFTPKDTSSGKTVKMAKAAKCDMDKCTDKSKCKNMDKCKDMSKCTDKDMSKSMGGKAINMDSKKTAKMATAQLINVKSFDKNKDGKVFQCPMDWDVISDNPGKDPKCGMQLAEVTIEQAKKNLTEHGFKVK